MNRIFSDYGIEIYEHNNEFYLQTDSGGAVSWKVELEITHEEAVKAQKSEQDAYEVLIACEKDKRPTRRV